jgi:exodeoxyribonuclease-5
MKLAAQQEKALQSVRDWWSNRNRPQIYRLFGYAGTGKTFLSKVIAEELDVKVAYASFTGKAALVMQKKGCYGAKTIHSLIYMMIGEDKDGSPIFDLNPASEITNVDLVIIDEVSMVGESLAKDLLSFNKPILVLGDPEQLPPVKDAGFFTDHEPDFMLTEIHRQALDNPIIRIASDARRGVALKKGNYDDKVRILARRDYDPMAMLEIFMESDQLIVGLNKTRHVCNELIREKLGREDHMPVVGDRLVCLRNNRAKNLLNGGLWCVDQIIQSYESGIVTMLKSEDFEKPTFVRAYTHPLFFEGKEADLDWKIKKNYDEFNYSYALTCHKCQGSQFNNVTLLNESASFREDAKRWLYTGITRAEDKLTIFI